MALNLVVARNGYEVEDALPTIDAMGLEQTPPAPFELDRFAVVAR